MTAAANPTQDSIATIEARMDGRISSMEAVFASFSRLMDERQKTSDARMDRMEAMLAEIRTNVANLRITIVITAVSSVLAIVLGVGALIASFQSNMLAALDSGKNTAEAQAEVKRQAEETAALLRKIQKDLDRPPKRLPDGG